MIYYTFYDDHENNGIFFYSKSVIKFLNGQVKIKNPSIK